MRPLLQSASQQRTAETLHWNHRVVKLFIVVNHDLLISSFADNDTSITPTEVIHTPKRVNGEEEAVNRIPALRDNVKTTRVRG